MYDETKKDGVGKFEHKKSLGQNFLTSDVVPRAMCDAANIIEGDTVIEIGPGTGTLTRELLKRGATVYAIETDARAVFVLTTTFSTEIADQKLHLYHADMREFDLSTILGDVSTYKVVANIPYYLSGFLLRTTLELPKPPETLVFLMQKEVVERIARPKKASLLSLSVAVYGTPKYVKTIGKGHFSPPPKVDSAILLVSEISHQNLPTERERSLFFEYLHLGLGQKRKQLLGCLTSKHDRALLEAIFHDLALAPTIRGEDLTLSQWLLLTHRLTNTPSITPSPQ